MRHNRPIGLNHAEDGDAFDVNGDDNDDGNNTDWNA
jgi:hypothetical protein